MFQFLCKKMKEKKGYPSIMKMMKMFTFHERFFHAIFIGKCKNFTLYENFSCKKLLTLFHMKVYNVKNFQKCNRLHRGMEYRGRYTTKPNIFMIP